VKMSLHFCYSKKSILFWTNKEENIKEVFCFGPTRRKI